MSNVKTPAAGSFPRRALKSPCWNEHLAREFASMWRGYDSMRIRASGLHSYMIPTDTTVSDAKLKAWLRRDWIRRVRCIDDLTAAHHKTAEAPR